MTWLIELIAALVKLFIPVIEDASKDTVIDAAPQGELKQRLQSQIKSAGWIAALMIGFSLSGCGDRAILVPSGTPVKIRETIPQAKVWILDKQKRQVATKMDIPAGWYALSLSETEGK